MTPSRLTSPEQTDWLQHQWVVAGVVAAAARFVPIPFFDDAIKTQCRRFVVARTLAASGSLLSAGNLKPLYGEPGGLLSRSLRAIAKAPLKLLLFPIRKVVLIATSIHGVPMEIMKTVLLGRTLRRLLSSGRIDPGRAEAVRLAFEDAFSRMDFRTVRAAISDSLRGVRSWRKPAVRMARNLFRRRRGPGETMPTDDQVERTADRVQQVLDQPETARLFEEFDGRFDQAYAARLAP